MHEKSRRRQAGHRRSAYDPPVVSPGLRHSALSCAKFLMLLALISCAATRLAVAGRNQAGRVAVAVRADQEPRIDGRLDEPVWAQAAVATDFVQREPAAGQPATERTDVRVLYSSRTLFIGARLFDHDASRIIATEYRRDAELRADDTFEVYLDTFHDRRNAFYFATNALGTERDGLVRNEGEDLNWQWDGVWTVACTRDADGWTVEMAIPFSTLRFKPNTVEDWGVNFGRLVARTREESYFAPLSRDFGFNGKWRVSAYGTLRGLSGVDARARFRLWPFTSAGWDRDYEEQFREPNGWTGEVGIDAKVAVGSSVVADLTYNTDFAQVEADQLQVNLTRFPLFFPEKRTFFLENAGLFRVGERSSPFEPPSTLLFFSRQIGLSEDGDVIPLIGGARVTGKLGAWDLGAFDIVADAIQLDQETRLPRTNFAAVRLKRDVLARSSVGGLYLAKTPAEEGSSNQVAAVDANFALGESLSVMGFAARSFTPGLTGSSHAANVDARFTTDRYGWGLAYLDIGDDFSSEMGFLQRTGVRKYAANAYLSRRPGWRGVRQIYTEAGMTYFTDRQNRLQTSNATFGPLFIFKDGSFLFANYIRNAEGLTEPFEIRDGVEIPVGTYRSNQFVVQYMASRSRRVSVGGGLFAGGFYGGTLVAPSVTLEARPHQRLTLGLEYYRNDIDVSVPGGTFTTNVLVGRGTLAFSPRAFLRMLLQRDDDAREARAQIVLRYTYRPGADLFVVYDDTRGILGETPPTKSRKFVVKMTFYLIPR